MSALSINLETTYGRGDDPGSQHHYPYWNFANNSIIRRKPCRFFAVGRCLRGDSCTFRHDVGRVDTSNGTFTRARSMSLNGSLSRPIARAGAYPPFFSHDGSNDLAVSYPQPYPPLVPSFQAPSFPSLTPFTPAPPDSTAMTGSGNYQYPHVQAAPHWPTEGRSYSAYLSANTTVSPTASSISPVTPSMADSSSISPSSPLIGFPRLNSDPWKAIQLPRRSDVFNATGKRPKRTYKTKTCEFFARNLNCVKGDSCTFIHDIPGSSSVQGGRVDDLDASPCGLPSRDPSPVDKVPMQVKKRDIYPITWRVIGGGVMMSGSRPEHLCKRFTEGFCDQGDDCPFFHDLEHYTSDLNWGLNGGNMPESEQDRKQESAALLHFSAPTSPPHDTHLRPPDDSLAASVGEQSTGRSLVQAVPRRARTIQSPFSGPLLGSKRASSVPVSTSGARPDVPRLLAAEAPGAL
ncbi:hypothetical protein PLICRDRAFT_494611 [Plicaturopsis crispa FD-325 SS-3]|uniref:C3H1-type domain-containing protein n=1 Tax=Plicaturopsis crispa FD-325 SS-3 TaxID=944288 RepID=A0A0C9SK30_PLICR|nr:hypothetical protein PLICRDRAFT_494611 [Plicaturopsis crispa FD-325 SS-3]